VDYIGQYLLDSLHASEGAIEIWLAQDAITGVPVLIYKPVIAEPPQWRIEGVLPWTGRVADAWVAELPFGARPLGEKKDGVTPGELTAWARRLLATLLEMRALELQHGRITVDRLWVKGSEVWLEGLGLPVLASGPDEVAVVEALKKAAGDTWQGWPFRWVLERLAEGRLSLKEAAERLSEPASLFDSDSATDGVEGSEAAHLEPPSTGTVRVLGRGEARSRPPAEEGDADRSKEEPADGDIQKVEPPHSYSLESEPAVEEVKVVRRGQKDASERAPSAAEGRGAFVENAAQEEKKLAAQPTSSTESAARTTGERPVVRIDEVSEPTFEVIEPAAGGGGRSFYRIFLLGLTVLLILFAVFWYGRREGGAVGDDLAYAVEFRLEPQGEHAELVLLEAPEGSQLESGRVLAVIPGRVYFDAPGVYRIQLRADGYLPQEKALVIPASSRVITVRLKRRGK